MRDIANPTAEDTARYNALLDMELTFTDIGTTAPCAAGMPSMDPTPSRTRSGPY